MNTSEGTTNLVWLRSDLRVSDNPALVHAAEHEKAVAVYCLSREQWAIHGVSEAKQQLILGSLATLDTALARLGIPLQVIDTDRFDSIPETLAAVCESNGVRHVFCNEEYEVNELALTSSVRDRLALAGVTLTTYNDQCLVSPGRVLTQSGDMFRVYSAFKKKFMTVVGQEMRPLYRAPSDVQDDVRFNVAESVRLNDQYDQVSEWAPGEEAAHAMLNRFVDESMRDYGNERDLPAVRGTSKLSPYLAVGVLSTRQCVQAVMNSNGGSMLSDNAGLNAWVNELIWREFYRHIIFAYPDVCKFKAFLPETDRLPWGGQDGIFEAWKAGRTGYPIVDAGMRELAQTSWMHNRVRMITAMFMTKHLFIDWRLGEQHFMASLIDGDLASNNGGWQWSASTGVDAAPYFRIFNPQRQSERFDPSGEYIRRFVPELAGLDKKSIHNPSSAQRRQCGYPEPVVDHAKAVARAKALFSGLSDHTSQELSQLKDTMSVGNHEPIATEPPSRSETLSLF